MNKEQTKEAIKVMQAYVDGKEIEYRNREYGKEFKRIHPDSTPIWSWEIDEYRIKPREWWICIHKYGISGPYDDKKHAFLNKGETGKPVKVREVLDDDN